MLRATLPRLLSLVIVFLTTLAHAEVQTRSIEYTHGSDTLVGLLAWDDAVEGKRPGILICHQWMGLGEHETDVAKRLAKLGYIALAVDIYGKANMPTSPAEAAPLAGKYRSGDRKALRDRMTRGLEELLKQDLVDPTRIAAIGYCFGGTAVLELARSGADIRGVVSFHGGLSTESPNDARNIKAKVLVCHGADDPHVPVPEVNAFLREMADADVDYQFIAYGNAVHSFTHRSAGDDPSKGSAYHADADRRSWNHMRQFFAEIFTKPDDGAAPRAD